MMLKGSASVCSIEIPIFGLNIRVFSSSRVTRFNHDNSRLITLLCELMCSRELSPLCKQIQLEVDLCMLAHADVQRIRCPIDFFDYESEIEKGPYFRMLHWSTLGQIRHSSDRGASDGSAFRFPKKCAHLAGESKILVSAAAVSEKRHALIKPPTS